MKNIYLILIVAFIGAGFGFSVFLLGQQIKAEQPILAIKTGWFDFLTSGFNCTGAIAKCTATASECNRRIRATANMCDERYHKAQERYNLYRQKAESYIPACNVKFTLCVQRAERYRSNADRFNRYMARCNENRSSCLIRAQEKRTDRIQRAETYIQKARERKRECDSRYIERQARNIERCASRASSCLQRVQKRCSGIIN